MEELRKFQSSAIDKSKVKIHRGSEHYFGIIRQNTGTAKWSKLCERFSGFSGCWISSQWKFPRYQSTSVIPTSSNLEGMLRHSFVTPSRREGPPSIFDTHGISGNVFANPDASSSALHFQELNQWNSSIEEPLHSSTVGEKWKAKMNKIWDASLNRKPKIQSSSAEEILQRIMGQTKNDYRFLIYNMTNSVRQQPLLAGR